MRFWLFNQATITNNAAINSCAWILGLGKRLKLQNWSPIVVQKQMFMKTFTGWLLLGSAICQLSIKNVSSSTSVRYTIKSTLMRRKNCATWPAYTRTSFTQTPSIGEYSTSLSWQKKLRLHLLVFSWKNYAKIFAITLAIIRLRRNLKTRTFSST